MKTAITGYRPRRWIRLPRAPRTGSPVPWLTSIHSTVRRGPYGNGEYRGNCGGYLIKDLLRFYDVRRVLDPMSGSNTCADVCTELGIECHAFDLNAGTNAQDPASYQGIGQFDFIWLHPPYWRMIRYSDDPRDLSNAATLPDFLGQLGAVLRHCRDVLAPDGKIAVLIGGYSDGGRYLPLAALTVPCAIKNGLAPVTEIIRLQHGNTSSQKRYRSSFIPGLHDTCLVFRRAAAQTNANS